MVYYYREPVTGYSTVKTLQLKLICDINARDFGVLFPSGLHA